jgi:hypothetical protein
VYSQEPGIATSSEYGLGGQGDRGADVIAYVQGSHEIEVASCKRRQTAKETDLSTWSDEFLDHWENHWKDQGVRRFVLAASAAHKQSWHVDGGTSFQRLLAAVDLPPSIAVRKCGYST